MNDNAGRTPMIKEQKRILMLCWMTYALAYMLRVNIAVAIPAIIIDRGYTYGQMGLVTGLFFGTYMMGQLICGYLGDHMSAKILVTSGLAFSILCNAGVAASSDFKMLAVFWALNGIAQSMLWAPLMKTLSVWFHGHQLEKVSYTMALSMTVGYAVSWGLSAFLIGKYGWDSAFYVPAALIFAHVLMMIFFFKSRPEQENETISSGKRVSTVTLTQFFRLISLPGLLLIAVMLGVIREGIGVWFPAIIREAGSPWAALVVVPFVNLGGVLLVRRINRCFRADAVRTLMFVFLLISVISAVAIVLHIKWFLLIPLLAMTYGITPILTSIIPFQYARYGHVSTLIGTIDFSIYSGAAMSGVLSGVIADRFDWGAVIMLWLVAACAGLILSLLRYNRNKGRERYGQTIHIE